MSLTLETQTAPGTEEPAVRLRVVDERVAAVFDGRVQAVAPGASAVLFMTEDNRVLELTHVATARAARLVVAKGQGAAIDHRGIDGTLLLRAGEAIALTVVARSDSQALGGDMEAVISVDDARVRVRHNEGNGFTLLLPDAALLTTVRVGALGLSTTIALEVLP